jgi:hypothetical protein
MDKEFWKGFLAWLELASEEELRVKIEKVNLLLEQTKNADVRSDARRMVRLMEQERILYLGRDQRQRAA